MINSDFFRGFLDALDEGVLKEAIVAPKPTPSTKAVGMGSKAMRAAGAQTGITTKSLKTTIPKPKVQKPSAGMLSNVRGGLTKTTGINPKATSAKMGLVPKTPKVPA